MKITVYIATSANGYISNVRNVPDWLSAEYGRGFFETCQRTKAVIMGRKTYDILAPDHLPLKDDGLSVVLTSRTDRAPANRTVRFTSARPDEIVSMLEEKGFSEAVVIGGASAVSAFVGAGLVTDLVMVVEPMLFGGEPLPLLRDVARDHRLELVESAKLNDHTVRLHYRVAGGARISPSVTSGPDRADDIVALSPKIHRVIFENDQIRLLKVTVKPGDTVGMHRNPENVNYILKPGMLRLTGADGSVADVALTEGQVIPAPVGSHAVENTGGTEVQTLCIELKTRK